MSKEEAERLVSAAVASLCEHFDAVQVLVSNVQHDGTASVFRGSGNWFARQGMAHEFIRQDQAQTDAAEMARVINPPD